MSNIPNDNITDIKTRKPITSNLTAGGGGGSMTLETRVGNLERSVIEIEKTLIRIEGKIDTKASAVEVAEIKGKISQMPSNWTLVMAIFASNLTICGIVFALIRFGIK